MRENVRCPVCGDEPVFEAGFSHWESGREVWTDDLLCLGCDIRITIQETFQVLRVTRDE
jgi:hypothetical protein